jgi:hypothetical protein
VDEAAAAAEELTPGVLASHPNINFQMHCQRLIELLRVSSHTTDLAGLVAPLSKLADTPADHALLQEVLALLVFPEPASSPLAHLMDLERRQELAAELTAAVRVHSGRNRASALERLHRQTAVAVDVALEHAVGAAAVVSVHDVYAASLGDLLLLPALGAPEAAAEQGADAMDMADEAVAAV